MNLGSRYERQREALREAWGKDGPPWAKKKKGSDTAPAKGDDDGKRAALKAELKRVQKWPDSPKRTAKLKELNKALAKS